MFNRNKNDKGKTSQQTRMKISQKLKAKAKGIRKAAGNLNTVKGAKKDAKNLLSKGLVKGVGGLGYVAGLASPDRNLTKQEAKRFEDAGNSKAGKFIGEVSKKAFDASNRGTRVKALGSLYKGAAKGAEDREELRLKKDEIQTKFKKKKN